MNFNKKLIGLFVSLALILGVLNIGVSANSGHNLTQWALPKINAAGTWSPFK